MELFGGRTVSFDIVQQLNNLLFSFVLHNIPSLKLRVL